MNAFTAESRDAVLSPNLRGLCTRLRAPASIAVLIQDWKPATVPLGDHLLKATLDQHLMACIVAGRYRNVQATLVALFGPADYASAPGPAADPEATTAPTAVVSPYGRRQEPPRKPPTAVAATPAEGAWQREGRGGR
jgi:hypothetical protein